MVGVLRPRRLGPYCLQDSSSSGISSETLGLFVLPPILLSSNGFSKIVDLCLPRIGFSRIMSCPLGLYGAYSLCCHHSAECWVSVRILCLGPILHLILSWTFGGILEFRLFMGAGSGSTLFSSEFLVIWGSVLLLHCMHTCITFSCHFCEYILRCKVFSHFGDILNGGIFPFLDGFHGCGCYDKVLGDLLFSILRGTAMRALLHSPLYGDGGFSSRVVSHFCFSDLASLAG